MEQSLPPYEMLPAGMNMDEMPPGGMNMDEMPPTTCTTVQVEEEQLPPRDHLVWSFCTALYGNILCLGLLAFFFSVKSRDRKMLGDHSGALSYGSTAKCLNITALVVNIIVIVIIIVIVVLVVKSYSYHPYHPYYP